MAARSRSPRRVSALSKLRRAQVNRAIKEASRATLERCLLACFDAGGVPDEILLALAPPQSPMPQELLIQTRLCNVEAQLPVPIMSELLPQKEKARLRQVSREWRGSMSWPAMWLELSCRHLNANAQEFLKMLSSTFRAPQYANVVAMALPARCNPTAALCTKLQRALPRVRAIDLPRLHSCHRVIRAVIESFHSLVHVRLSGPDLGLVELRELLNKHSCLQTLEVSYPHSLRGDLELAQAFPDRGNVPSTDLGRYASVRELSLCFPGESGRRFVEAPRRYNVNGVWLDVTQAMATGMAQRFLTSFPNLRKLALANWMRFEASDVEAVLALCPHLQELRMPGIAATIETDIVTHDENWHLRPLAEPF